MMINQWVEIIYMFINEMMDDEKKCKIKEVEIIIYKLIERERERNDKEKKPLILMFKFGIVIPCDL